jgi:hypothetical protein
MFPFSFISGAGIDAQAAAFIAAAGITDPTQITAINRLVLNYKGIGNINNSVDLWSGTLLILPLVGGTAAANQVNLKDALTVVTFFGGLTHNSNGLTGNGTNGYGLLSFAPDALAQDNNRITAYLRTDTGATGYVGVIGATGAGFTNGIDIEINKTSANIATYNNTTFRVNSLATRTGLFGVNRVLSTQYKDYRNGVPIFTNVVSSLSPISTPFALLANNNNGSLLNYSPENVAFYSAGNGLSDANILIEYNIIQQFQTDLGRQV